MCEHGEKQEARGGRGLGQAQERVRRYFSLLLQRDARKASALIAACLREGVSNAALQGILLGSVQVPSLDSAETSLECGDSLAEGTLGTRRTMGDSVETSGRGDGGRAEADTKEIAEGLELHSRPPKHGHLWASHSEEGDAEIVVPEGEEEVEGSRQVGEFERSTEVSRRMR
uniref:Uncharacterized protein n=1 Tax=Chromera velia CCMP2878 TaxID=1169474 RepID=A0A0G4FV61_9ALVE|eukprot:Cvel_3796.t1-p1 / transcript=Cvel_3796.t1 / gene=Cvel_3796 / organism=Chromera_velia_CCMP2878 / gene_product=hypothetical protein / transcript_product=hypothetical protein / location=Cvel_scaffold159:100001-101827(-) / protein_length=171 / sequence_SO=supercontig / SO=protein_coding / is_pseudo=false